MRSLSAKLNTFSKTMRMMPLLLCLGGCALQQAPVGAPPPAGAVVAHIPMAQGPTLLALAPDGARLYAASTSSVSVIDTSSRRVLTTVRTTTNPTGIAITADGNTVYVAHLFSDELTVLDAKSGTLFTPITLIQNQAVGGYGRIAVSRDGSRAYVANGINQQLAIVDLAANSVRNFQLDMIPADLALTPDGDSLYITGCKGFCVPGTVAVFDTRSQTMGQTFEVGTKPYRIAMSPDGNRAYVANLTSPSVSVVDVAARSVTATVPLPTQPTDLALSPDRRQLFAVSQDGNGLTVIDTALNIARGTVQPGDRPREVVMSLDGKWIYVSADNEIVVIDAQQWPGR